MPAGDTAPVDCDPLAALLPDQLPPAVQLVGLLATLHDTVALPPVVILDGETEILIAGGVTTVTVAEPLPEPEEFVHVSV